MTSTGQELSRTRPRTRTTQGSQATLLIPSQEGNGARTRRGSLVEVLASPLVDTELHPEAGVSMVGGGLGPIRCTHVVSRLPTRQASFQGTRQRVAVTRFSPEAFNHAKERVTRNGLHG